MASTSLYNPSYTSCSWTISGLGNPFNSSNYIKVGVTKYSFSNGASSISGIVGYVNAPSSGTSTSVSGTASGLTYNATQTLYGFAQTPSGGYYNAGSASITTIPYPIPSTPSAPLVSSRGEGSLNVYWGSVSYADYYTLRYRHYSGVYSYRTVYGTSYNLTGLEYGVTYFLSVSASNSSGTSSYSTENGVTTLPQTPSISQGTVTSNSIQINIGNVSGSSSYIRVYKYTSGGSLLGYLDGYENSSVTFTGLTSGTTYKFNAKNMFVISGSTLESYYYSNELTVTVSARPSNWSWSFTISSGSPIYNTVYSGGTFYAYIMTASEWNSFTSRINQFRTYKGLSYYWFTTATSGEIITNTLDMYVNQAITAINQMGFSQSAVSAGQSVSASVFITMKNNLNSIV